MYDVIVRTTLDIDDDILSVAKQLAQQKQMTAGQVISDLVRQSLENKAPQKFRNGVPLLTPKPGAERPTLALVNELRDEE
jgi:hypothetical protein